MHLLHKLFTAVISQENVQIQKMCFGFRDAVWEFIHFYFTDLRFLRSFVQVVPVRVGPCFNMDMTVVMWEVQ